jgi:hypothetical protein
MKTTLVIGASQNPERYSNKAILSLIKHGFTVVALGLKTGEINGIKILNNKPQISNIDTVTLYISSKNQIEWIDYILDLNPKRIIFNPGAENDAFFNKASKRGIECLNACTLVMLSVGTY